MNIYVTYLIIAAILVAAELLYFRIADRRNSTRSLFRMA